MGECVLPLDVVHDILPHLPAKPHCRLRAVCRPWRSLLSEPLFIAAHAARHPGPHLIASCIRDTDDGILLSIIDLSGQIIKQIHRKKGDTVTGMAAGVVCVRTVHNGSYRLLNPSTGAVCHVLDRLADEHLARGLRLRACCVPVLLFSQAAGKGEYKVLRMLRRPSHGTHRSLFEVCTLNCNSRGQWRVKQAPALQFVWDDHYTRVVIDGVVYLLSLHVFYSFDCGRHVTEKDWIVSFDLETEEWRPNIKGPSSLIVNPAAADMRERLFGRASSEHIALTNLNGSLVIVLGQSSFLDMWYLTDSEESLWAKQYSVQVEPWKNHLVHPLLVLDDGRIVIIIRNMRLLQIYDPRSNTFTDVVRLRNCWEVSMYTGNLLTLDGHNP